MARPQKRLATRATTTMGDVDPRVRARAAVALLSGQSASARDEVAAFLAIFHPGMPADRRRGVLAAVRPRRGDLA